MLSRHVRIQPIASILTTFAFTALLLIAALPALLHFSPPAHAAEVARPAQQHQGMGAQPGMMPASTSAYSPTVSLNTMPMNTMSMGEMGYMMDAMMAQMHSMMAMTPMSGTAAMDPGDMGSMMHMGQMMHMMGMMHMHMGQMQMMMGNMQGMMAQMPMSDTVAMGNMESMAGMESSGMASMMEMGHMMQMMGMMQMMNANMMHCAMMGREMTDSEMMDNGVMGGDMMDNGMDAATPAATPTAPTATVQPEATATPEVTVDQSAHPAPALHAAPQHATAGAVEVEAVPLATDDVLDVAFAVTLETHSVELDFDLAERATLTIGDATFPAATWQPDAPSGHHVKGTLHFTIDHPAHASLVEVDEVTLQFSDIDGAAVTLRFAVGG